MPISQQNSTLPKIVVILGPTASGKTSLGVKLATEFNGEIISADSRQVYRGMDVGTGKDLAEYGNIPYHMIDVADPKEVFDLAQYKKQAEEAISDILDRGKLPIIVGGSGLYLQALVDNYQLSTVKPDVDLRADLETKTLEELQDILESKNKTFFDKLNNSDRNNKRRLVRYIEVSTSDPLPTSPLLRGRSNAPSPYQGGGWGGVSSSSNNKKYDTIIIGLTWPKEVLAERIERRLKERLDKEDMVEEVKGLHDLGVTWERLESFGLEYKFISQYLQEKISYETMFAKINLASNQFAKRQLTWFKRWERGGKEIVWENDYNEVREKVEEFIEPASS